MENNSNDKEWDVKAMSDAELIEKLTGHSLPDLTLSRLLSFSRKDWKNLEARIGPVAVLKLVAVLELRKRWEEEND